MTFGSGCNSTIPAFHLLNYQFERQKIPPHISCRLHRNNFNNFNIYENAISYLVRCGQRWFGPKYQRKKKTHLPAI